ncbi:MAG: class I SAM-dependent methyltransferase [Candidatus Marinimicrobia bacterium]|nr:class I SAM-dependent methyltransferase [Candidatus Neomarinimicrobiota bacterium]
MKNKIFDPNKLNKLNNTHRLKEIPPEFIWKNLNLKNPKILVDIGAGTGFITKEFIKLLGDGKIYAFDISNIMVEWMKNNLCNEYPNIYPKVIFNDSLPMKDKIADLVYMITLHHEIENHEKLLKESHRVLKVGGKIFIVDWKKKETTGGPPISIRFQEEVVAEQLAEAGFQNIEIINELQNHFYIFGEK